MSDKAVDIQSCGALIGLAIKCVAEDNEQGYETLRNAVQHLISRYRESQCQAE